MKKFTFSIHAFKESNADIIKGLDRYDYIYVDAMETK